MKGERIPEQNHVSRYCSATRCTESGEVTGAAFQLHPQHVFLSVNWLEFLQLLSRDEEVNEIRKVLSSKLRLGTGSKIAVLNVGELLKSVRIKSPDGKKLSVLHEPEEIDPSHSGVYGFSSDDDMIADLIAQVVSETYPAKEA